MARVNSGRALLRAGNFAGVRKTLEDALRDAPYDRDAWELHIDLLIEQEHFAKALELTRDCLARWPDGIQLRYLECRLLLSNGDHAGLETAVTRFEGDFPDERRYVLLLRAIEAVKFGSLSKAKALREEIAANGGVDAGLVALDYLIADASDDLLDKLRAAKNAFELDPMDGDACTNLAFARFESFGFGAAKTLARNALRLNPTNQKARAIPILIWLILFPPFLLAQGLGALFTLPHAAAPMMIAGLGFIYVLGAYPALLTIIPPFVIVASLGGLIIWFPLKRGVIGYFEKQGHNDRVELRDF